MKVGSLLINTLSTASSELFLWSLAASLCAPPAIVLFHSSVNAFAHKLVREGLSLSTPGLRVLGHDVIPSYTLFRFIGPRGGKSHVYSGLDQAPVKKGETFTLLDGTVIEVSSGYGWRGDIGIAGASKNHKGVDLAASINTPIYAPLDGVKVQCWWDSGGGGGQVADIWIGPELYQALHLAECHPGTKAKGEVLAHTGDSGIGSAHLHWQQQVHGSKVHPKRGMLQAVLNPTLMPEYHNYAGRPSLEDTMITCVIGYIEGAATKDCEKTNAYWGHRDSNRHNHGFFSSTNGYPSPEAADSAELAKLKGVTPRIQEQAKEIFGSELSEAALLMTLDLKNQSPDAANRLFKYLPSADPTPEEIINARTAALTESRREIGTGGSPNLNVAADQTRRVTQGLDAMTHFENLRQENRDK